MAMTTNEAVEGAGQAPSRFGTSLPSLIFRLGALAVIDALTIWLVYQMFGDGYFTLGGTIAFVTIWLNFIFLNERYYPLRWISPGLALMIIMVLYPIVFTVIVSFTNYGTGHMVSKQIAIEQIESQVYLPADAVVYNWVAYVDPANQYMLWMTDPNTGESFTVTPGGEPVPREGDPPQELEGFTLLPSNQLFARLTELSSLVFGLPPDNAYRVSQQKLGDAAQYEQRYVYDPEQDAMVDQETDVVYVNVDGVFTAPDGSKLSPGFAAGLGAANYLSLFTDPGLRSTFMYVFGWTVIFAFTTVLITFSLGLFLAINFDVPDMPFQRALRALLLIPYTIPVFVAVPVWVGLLNPQFGVISQAIGAVFGWIPPWFSDPFWSKIGILMVQLWLGFPYMFVIVTGALQTLDHDVYEAADLDGAGAWSKFRAITLPLLLITVGPLLVASFAFNFNNFAVIDLYNRGGPPIPNVPTPVGYTDILATYTYRIAFGSTGTSDYGYASAITVMIFIILVIITMFQFRYTNMLEERGRNV